MKFNLPRRECPTIRVIPMLTVMMGILAYFVLLPFQKPSFQMITLTLPQTEQEAPRLEQESSILPLVLQMSDSGDLIWQQEKLSIVMAKGKIVEYLTNNPLGTVYLSPHPRQTYRQVLESWQSIRDLKANSLPSHAHERILLTWNQEEIP